MFVYLYLCVCTNHTREDVLRSQWQRACYRLLRPSEAHIALIHLRRRLDRWNLTLLPGRRVSRAVLLLRGLGAAAPPRVGAAVLRTFCNGWITGRRMQRAHGPAHTMHTGRRRQGPRALAPPSARAPLPGCAQSHKRKPASPLWDRAQPGRSARALGGAQRSCSVDATVENSTTALMGSQINVG